jgi:hypothetical protein
MALYYIDVLVGMIVIGIMDYFFIYRKNRSIAVDGAKKSVREMAQSVLRDPISYSYDGGVLFIPLPVSIVAFLAWQDLGYENGEHVFAIVFLATILTIVAIGRRVTQVVSSWMLYTSTTFVLLSFISFSGLSYLLLTSFAVAVGCFSLSVALHRKE